MKKFLFAALAGAMILGLVACGGNNSTAPAETKAAATSEVKAAELPEAIPCASRAGTFTGDDGTVLKVEDEGKVSLEIVRLAQMDGVVTAEDGDNLVIQALDPNGNIMDLEFNCLSHTLTVKGSTWDLLPTGESFELPGFTANHEPV